MTKLRKMIQKAPAALVLLNGDRPPNCLLNWLWSICDKKIAADGALNFLLRTKLRPNITIGDLDSVSVKNLAKITDDKLLKIANQNQTDSQKAFDYLIGLKKYLNIHICGFPGSRFDHMLYNLKLLQQIKAQNPDLGIFIWTGSQIIFLLKKSSIMIDDFSGAKISIICDDNLSANISTSGFKYELSPQVMKKFNNFSISNQINSASATLKANTSLSSMLVIIEHQNFFVNY